MPIRILNNYIHRQVLYLAVIEGLIMICAVYAGAYLRFGGRLASVVESIGSLWPRAILVTLVVMASMVAMGLYHGRLRTRLSGIAVRVIVSGVAAGAALALLYYWLPKLYLGRGALAITMTLIVIGILLTRIAFFKVVDDKLFRRRVLVYGAGQKAANIVGLRRRADQRGFKVVGFLPAENTSQYSVDPDLLMKPSGTICELAAEHRIDEIVVAIDDRRKGFLVQELLDCKLNGVGVIDAMSFFERETGKVKLDLLYPSWMIFSEGFSSNPMRVFTSRVFDILAALFLLLITWPFMLIVVVAIWWEDGIGAPIFYRQERVGLRNSIFPVMKFRSMIADAEKDGVAKWAEKNDSRITKVGSVIRKYRIDELPQIFNVLRGDMRFVGPRPERPSFVDELSREIPYYKERHTVKPGITGWAQLCYEYGASNEDALEKLQYDLFYVKNHNMLFDLLILLQTAEVVLWKSGAR